MPCVSRRGQSGSSHKLDNTTTTCQLIDGDANDKAQPCHSIPLMHGWDFCGQSLLCLLHRATAYKNFLIQKFLI